MTTVTRLERNIETAEAYLDKIIGAPAWAKNGEPPQPANVKGTSCFCAGVTNLARRAVGLEIPTLGNQNFDGGIVAYFGATEAAPASFPRQGYFERHGKLRRFNLEEARRPWTLIGRKYRNVNHILWSDTPLLWVGYPACDRSADTGGEHVRARRAGRRDT